MESPKEMPPQKPTPAQQLEKQKFALSLGLATSIAAVIISRKKGVKGFWAFLGFWIIGATIGAIFGAIVDKFLNKKKHAQENGYLEKV